MPADALFETAPPAAANAEAPLIQALHRQAEDWRCAEVARARKLLARGAQVDEVLQALAGGLTRKMLHGAMVELHSGDSAQRECAASVVRRVLLR